ncbi:hypothetical protein DPMN_067734 [Dreissena polymorpha]|uniref:Uncharacterized protein n=1 Tax=Dreissena polymorpha TaxID=45954 RepID=A0A9D4BTS5_DREPO|nr:hypothetical protein DPMN_067734 [Dreissena polymorpha]
MEEQTDGRTDVLTDIKKNAQPLGSHVFQAKIIIFKIIQDIIETNLLNKLNEDWTIKVASNVLTRFYDSKMPAIGGHVFKATKTIFELIHPTINVASRVKNGPPLGSHVFQARVSIFKLFQDIIGTNLLIKFHEDRKINVASRVLTRKNAPPPGGHVFQPTGIIFKLVQDIIRKNLLIKFHEYQTINVKYAPPLGSHVFQANITIFELFLDIIETNRLTKFHEDWTLNVASRELTKQMLTPHNGRRTTDKGDHRAYDF